MFSSVSCLYSTQPVWKSLLLRLLLQVREVLCELEVPYLLKTCARGSMKREAMLEKYDHFQVPCLEVIKLGGMQCNNS